MLDLLAIAQIACEIAQKAGAEFVEVIAGQGKNMTVELEKGAIKSTDVRWSSDVAVRAYVKGGKGFAHTTGLAEKDVRATAQHAAQLAKIAEPDPEFLSLPTPATYEKVEGLFDPRIADLEIAQVIDFAVQNIDAAKAVADDVIVAGGAGAWSGESALVNSLGIQVIQKRTNIGASIYAIIKRADDVGSFYEYDYARMLDDFEPTDLGTKATREALRYLNSRKIGTKVLSVIFGPRAAHSLFSALCYNANAEDIQRNRSYLIGKKGEWVASELVTVIDDGLYPRGMASSPYDDEGFPHKPLTVVEKGVLQTYLHNSYTANKAKEPNTGHATWGGISPTNVRPQPGNVLATDIIKDTKEGLYIDTGWISPNSVTGEISATVDFGFKIENGEIAHPVKNTMIGINMLELLKNIDAISADYRKEPGIIMPTIRAQGVKVAGGR